jgi:polar amino acid transport system substrate-binding protein
MFTRNTLAAIALSLTALLQGCAHTSPEDAAKQSQAAAQHVLAPTGTLRVAMYQGSPTSYVTNKDGDDPRGVGYDVGQAFAQKLGVPFEAKVFPNNAEALKAVANGDADFTFTNATDERAQTMDFSPTVLDVEKSALVVKNSRLKKQDDLKRKGLRIGVSKGSSTGEELKEAYPKARLVPVATLAQAVEMLRKRRIDAFATNNAILYELSDKLPGSRVLPDHWGLEHFAIGVPKGREAGQDFVKDFVQAAVANGTVQKAVERANVRGTVSAQ